MLHFTSYKKCYIIVFFQSLWNICILCSSSIVPLMVLPDCPTPQIIYFIIVQPVPVFATCCASDNIPFHILRTSYAFLTICSIFLAHNRPLFAMRPNPALYNAPFTKYDDAKFRHIPPATVVGISQHFTSSVADFVE